MNFKWLCRALYVFTLFSSVSVKKEERCTKIIRMKNVYEAYPIPLQRCLFSIINKKSLKTPGTATKYRSLKSNKKLLISNFFSRFSSIFWWFFIVQKSVISTKYETFWKVDLFLEEKIAYFCETMGSWRCKLYDELA